MNDKKFDEAKKFIETQLGKPYEDVDPSEVAKVIFGDKDKREKKVDDVIDFLNTSLPVLYADRMKTGACSLNDFIEAGYTIQQATHMLESLKTLMRIFAREED